MERDELLKFATDLFSEAESLLKTKNEDYAKQKDVFRNFDKVSQIAEILGLDVKKREHGALYEIVKKLCRLVNLEDKEPWHESVAGSCVDAINYIVLYYGMRRE